MRCPEAVPAGSCRFPKCHQQRCRPQGSAGQRRPGTHSESGWRCCGKSGWGKEALRPKGAPLRGLWSTGNLHQSGDTFLRGLHPRHTGNTPEGQPSFSIRCLFHSLKCPGQSNDFLSWIIPVTLLNLLHPTIPGEASFFHKLFEYYTCKRILCMSWRYTQHSE